jgi:spore germination protein KC
MVKKIILVFLLGWIIVSSGCWDRRELESLGLVQVLGLDLSGNKNEVAVTVMIAIPSQITGGGGQSGGGGSAKSGVLTITMAAPTIYEAFNRINTTINREITLIQNTVLIISEDLAKQGVNKWMDTLVRFREMRRTMIIFVCRGKAAEIMKVQPVLEKNPSEYFNDLVELHFRNGMFPVATFNDFLESYEAYAQENYAPLLSKFEPMELVDNTSKGKESGGKEEDESKSDEKPSQDTKNIRIIGTAIFKKAKMVGTLDIYESQILELLTGEFREAALTIADPEKKNYQIAYRLLAAKPLQIKYHLHKSPSLDGGQEDQLNVNINLEADILSIQSSINYTTPKNEVMLGNYIAREVKRRVQKVIRKTQKEYRSDVFGFGKTVRSSFITSAAWENFGWPERFPNAKISVKVNVAIRRVGVQFQPPEFR